MEPRSPALRGLFTICTTREALRPDVETGKELGETSPQISSSQILPGCLPGRTQPAASYRRLQSSPLRVCLQETERSRMNLWLEDGSRGEREIGQCRSEMVLCSITCTVSESDVLNHYTHSLSTCFKECVCRASAESSFSLVSTRPTSTQPFSMQTSGRHQVLFPKTKLAFIPLPMSLLSLRGTLFRQSRSILSPSLSLIIPLQSVPAPVVVTATK